MADQVDLVLRALLAMQRQPWEQGVASQALLDLGRTDLAGAMARDAVVRQSDWGSLGEMGDDGGMNGAANGEAVRWLAGQTSDPVVRQALERQLRWLLHEAPRAADGTLFHLRSTREVWADTVYMTVPLLVLVGETGAALTQLRGHRARLHDPQSGLYSARWDEDSGSLSWAVHWGTGNGWVVAGIARAIRQAGSVGPLAAEAHHAREVIEACLSYRRDDGLFHDVVDRPDSFAEVNLCQMLAYAIFLGVADGWLPPSWGPVGTDLLATALRHVDPTGLVSPVCGAPRFDRPGTSAEAQAFFLLAMAAAGTDDRGVRKP